MCVPFILEKDMNEDKYMKIALKEAQKSLKYGEIPIGAIIVRNGEIISKGYNRRNKTEMTADHAEMMAISRANRKLNTWRLDECEMYVTLEPCPMCAGAIHQARIKKVYYGARNPKAGFLGSRINIFDVKGLNHYPEITGGILEEECSAPITQFFKNIRNKAPE